DRGAGPGRAGGQIQPAAQDRGPAGRCGGLRGPGCLPALRGAGRPGLMAPPAAAPRTTRLTGRAAVLAVVICAIALSLAYPVREYIAQRRQIDQLQAQSQATTAELGRLRAEALRLGDPAYIEQQAQDRLHMCLPGANCYVIIGG